MSYNFLNEPWEQIPFSFSYPYFMIWFLSPDGYIDGYMFDYGSFRLVDEQAFGLGIPFSQLYKGRLLTH